MKGYRILLTGGSGFVGIAIIDQIKSRHSDWQITVADLEPPAEDFAERHGLHYIKTDVKEPQQCRRAIQEAAPDLIIHVAGRVPVGLARYSRKGRDDLFALNVGGTENMLSAAKSCNIPNFLFTGSCTSITDDFDHEYPNYSESVPYPRRSTIYGESKAAAEQLVLAVNSEKFATCSLKPSVIFGDQDYQLVPSIQECIEKGETPFIIGSGDNLYDFTHVTNVGYAHALAAENLFGSKTAAGEAILISNDQPITFRDFCLAIWAQFGHVPPWTVRVPGRLAWVFGAIVEGWARTTGRKTTFCRGSVKDAIGTRYADLTKAKSLLGYEPVLDMWDAVKLACDTLKRRMEKAEKGEVAAEVRGHG